MDKTTDISNLLWKNIPPALDMRKLFEKVELPKLDLQTLVEARRRDIDALVEANREAYQALETLGKRQQEILSAALASLQQNTNDVLTTEGLSEKASRSAQHAQAAFKQALTDMRELAQMAVDSNKQVLSVLNDRVKEGLKDAGVTLPAALGGSPEAAPKRTRAAATPTKTAARKRKAHA